MFDPPVGPKVDYGACAVNCNSYCIYNSTKPGRPTNPTKSPAQLKLNHDVESNNMSKLCLILFAGLTIMAVTALAQIRPDLWPQGWHAGGLANERDATKAFNFLQDALGKPQVSRVYGDPSRELYVWKGPRSGKWMSMGREGFDDNIMEPYYKSQELILGQ
jgi:hypothetical protein